MRFQILREFLTVAETLSFSAASEKLFVSQATLSKHIRSRRNSASGFPNSGRILS